MTNVEKLKKLAVALGCAETTAGVTGTTVAEVIDFISTKYKSPTPSAPTAEGDYKLSVNASGKATWTKITG